MGIEIYHQCCSQILVPIYIIRETREGDIRSSLLTLLYSLDKKCGKTGVIKVKFRNVSSLFTSLEEGVRTFELKVFS